MATVDEDVLTIYDDINAHNDIKPEQTDSNLEHDHDTKQENNKINKSTSVTEPSNKHSSLLDLDSIPQHHKNKSNNSNSSTEDDKKTASQSTESVQVYIYRRTSLVTSSGGASVMKIDDTEMTGPMHSSTETGMNLWDNTTTTIENYQLQEVNTFKNDNKYNENKQNKNKNDKLLNKTAENEQISILKYDQNRSRHSIDVDEQHNNTVIRRKSSSTSVLYQENEINNEEILTRPVRSTSVIYYAEGDSNNTDSQINERMSNKNEVNDSAILEMIPSNHNKQKVYGHDLDEEFYKEIKNKQRISQKEQLMEFSNVDAKNKIRKSEIETSISTKNKNKLRKSEIETVIDDNYDIKEEMFTPQITLTAQNLMVHDYKHSLNEMDEIKNDMELEGNNNNNKKNNNRLRYIAMTDNIQQQQQASMSFLIQKKENEKKYEKSKKLSTRIKYITAVGAICAVSILVGVVLYSRNNEDVSSSNAANMLMTPPRRRRLPPRIG